jgi:hypothetical protein
MENSTLFSLISKFNFDGVSFVSLKGYKSDKSDNTEVADHLINVGVTYESLKKKDLELLQNANAKELENENFGVAIIEQAIEELIKSIVSPNERRSTAQKESVIRLNNGMQYCPNTDSLLIVGTEIRKTVIVKGEHKTVNSKPLTLAKKYVTKALNLPTSKIRRFSLKNLSGAKVMGETFEIGGN